MNKINTNMNNSSTNTKKILFNIALNAKGFFQQTTAVLLLLVGWQIVAMFLSAESLPTPVNVIQNMKVLITESNLLFHMAISLTRLLIGITTALFFGATAGILLGNSKVADKWLSPVVYVLFPIPKAALIPILFLFLGIGEASKLVLVFLIIVFQFTLSARDAVKNLPVSIIQTSKLLKLNPVQHTLNVLIPAVLPAILSSLRIGVGIGLAVLFFAENYATETGIGYFIMNSWSLINYLDMYSGIIAMSFIGIILMAIIDILEKIFVQRYI